MDKHKPINGLKADPHWDTEKRTVEVSGFWRQLLLSPWHDPNNRPDFLNSLVSFLLELIYAMILGWFVNTAKSAASGPSVLVDSVFIGLIYAVTFYVAWIWTVDYGLRRHGNWAITWGYMWVGRAGILAFLLYSGMQFGGAAIAGAILSALGAGSVPDYSAAAVATTSGMAWGLEFFGSFLIVFSLLWNEMLEQPKEEEEENHKRAGFAAAVAIFLLVSVFFRNQVYSFGNVVYFAGLVAVGAAANSDLPATGMVDWAHYLFTPLAGASAALLVYWALYLLIQVWNKSSLNPAVQNDRAVSTRNAYYPGEKSTPLLAATGREVRQRKMNTAALREY